MQVLFNKSRNTIRKHVTSDQYPQRKRRTTIRFTIPPTLLGKLASHIQHINEVQLCGITVAELQSWLVSNGCPVCSPNTLLGALRRHGWRPITARSASTQDINMLQPLNEERVNKFKSTFSKLVNDVKPHVFFWIDETVVRRLNGIKGRRGSFIHSTHSPVLYIRKNPKEGGKVSVISAGSSDSNFKMDSISTSNHENTNSVIFHNYFETAFVPVLKICKNLQKIPVVIMDNAAYHKAPKFGSLHSKTINQILRIVNDENYFPQGWKTKTQLLAKVKKQLPQLFQNYIQHIIESHGGVLLYTPPKSWHFQPIENWFAVLKMCLVKMNTQVGDCDDLVKTIKGVHATQGWKFQRMAEKAMFVSVM